jgi:uncharacterized protein
MAGQDDVEVVTRWYDAMARQDVEALLAALHPSCVITQDPALPWGGRYEGHEQIGEFFLRLVGNIDSRVETFAIFAADDVVVQMGRTRGTVRANGAAFDIPEVHVWTVRDGLAVAAQFRIDTPAMLAVLHS